VVVSFVATGTGQAGGEKRQILLAVALLALIVLAGYISYSKFVPHRQVVTYGTRRTSSG
jgi:hypothetical protein